MQFYVVKVDDRVSAQPTAHGREFVGRQSEAPLRHIRLTGEVTSTATPTSTPTQQPNLEVTPTPINTPDPDVQNKLFLPLVKR